MTVTEAAQLVIQAGAMAKNSEVFLLDMGERKNKDLIYKMINLSGLGKDSKILMEILRLRLLVFVQARNCTKSY